MRTDAEKIYRYMMEKNKDDTQQSSTTTVELRDMGTQMSLATLSEDEIELLDISIKCEQDSTKSDYLTEIVKTSFIETRSGDKYPKHFVMKGGGYITVQF